MWALVLAGGSSRRMGQAKQDLRFGPGTLLEGVVSVAREVAEEVILLGDDATAGRLGLRAVRDHEPGAGPLSALAGGLAACPEGLHALLACDMPFLEADVLQGMVGLSGYADAVIPMVDGRRHPLCGLYRTSCLEPARACLAAGKHRMDDLLDRVVVCNVVPEQLRPLDLARAVTNVNTPEDYQRALQAQGNDEHGT